MLSPIVIFAYNRPKHLKVLLDSLEKNRLEKKRKIFLYCDGPKSNGDKKKITQIKSLLKKKKKYFFYKIKFQKKNIGLSKNIIGGISEVLKDNDRCIVLEDDLVINSMTIEYMDKALSELKFRKDFGSVSAYSYLQNFGMFKSYDYYITKRHCSWCWGTWRRVWNSINWDSINYDSHFKSKNEINNFAKAGNDLNLLFWAQKKSIIDSWAIRFNYHCFKKKLLSFQPRFSLIANKGRDNSGTHERLNLKLSEDNIDYYPNLKIKNLLKKTIRSNKIDYFIKKSHRRSIKLSLRYFFQYFRLV